jgi:hypothetical protein
MSVWGSVFGWKTLFRWDVLGAVIPGIFLAVGIGILTVDWFPHNLLISQVSLTIAALISVVKFFGQAIESEGGKLSRTAFALTLSAIAILFWWLALAVATICRTQTVHST